MKSFFFGLFFLLASSVNAQTTRESAPAANPFDVVRSGSQAPAALRTPVTVFFENETLNAALREVGRLAGISFSYSNDLPGLTRRVSLKATDIETAEALLRLLRGSGLELLVARNGKMISLRAAPRISTSGWASIQGVVRDASTGAPLSAVDVVVTGTNLRTLTAPTGAFRIARVPAGQHAIEAGLLGYSPKRVDVIAQEGADVSIDVELTPAAIPLTEVVIAPGHFGIAHESVGKAQSLTKEQLETLPQLGEDIYRAVNRLPGVGSNEMKAKFNVRGGNDESLLVTLDGLELYEPFHLKDFDGSLSIIDLAAVGGVDLTTGGFGAQFGNRLTGLFQMTTTTRIPPRPKFSLGLSLSNARFMSQGAFANGNGLWLLSARRGYIDILLDLINEPTDINPRYYDVLGKVVYQLSSKHRVAANLLHAGDTGSLIDDDGVGTLSSSYGSSYGWLTWTADWNERVRSETVVSAGALDWRRSAEEFDPPNNFNVADDRNLALLGLRQNWHAQFGERFVLKWGAEVKSANAKYDYFATNLGDFSQADRIISHFDTIDTELAPETNEIGLYIAPRLRPWNPLTLELGVRWDHQSHTDESQISPRFNLALAVDRNTTLRAAWGRYAQPQALHQLRVQDGEQLFHSAERAEQFVLGLERHFGRGWSARVEAYRRDEWNLRPRYVNLDGYIEAVGEVNGDRARITPTDARAEGIEFFAQRATTRASYGMSYSLARAEDNIDGVMTPRPLDQRHTFYIDYSYAPSPAWRLSVAWQYHTGWPITPSIFTTDSARQRIFHDYGPYNSDRLPDYHRMDFRATRVWQTPHGRVAVFLDVFNLYDHKNPQAYNYSINFTRGGALNQRRGIETLLPRLPTIGVTWEF
jgi:hypothetical protein